ncbi:hypothetical protein ALC53_09504, partial [Atta colombica]
PPPPPPPPPPSLPSSASFLLSSRVSRPRFALFLAKDRNGVNDSVASKEILDRSWMAAHSLWRLPSRSPVAGGQTRTGIPRQERGERKPRKSRLAKSSKVSRESIAADAPPSRRASPDKSGSMPEDDDAGHKHSRDKREEATSTTALRWTVIPMIRKREI